MNIKIKIKLPGKSKEDLEQLRKINERRLRDKNLEAFRERRRTAENPVCTSPVWGWQAAEAASSPSEAPLKSKSV